MDIPDRNGKPGDMTQSYETLDPVMSGQGSMGAFIGRYANGSFKLDRAGHLPSGGRLPEDTVGFMSLFLCLEKCIFTVYLCLEKCNY